MFFAISKVFTVFFSNSQLLDVEAEIVDVVAFLSLEFPSHMTTSFSPIPVFCLGDAEWVYFKELYPSLLCTPSIFYWAHSAGGPNP